MHMLPAGNSRVNGPIEVKFLNNAGLFEGYASVFHVTDSVGDKVLPGAFARSLSQFKDDRRLPPLLWQHDTNQPIGAWREIFEDAHGLFVRGELFVSDIARAREAFRLLKEDVVTGLSIGYRVRKSHRDQKTGTRMISDIDLLEISMVTFPANAMARVSRVKTLFAQGQIPPARDVEAFLREAGLSRKQAKGMLAHGYQALFDDMPRDACMTDAEAIQALIDKIRALT